MWLQGWYTSMCDGDWEHAFGVKIETLDNPGWSVAIDVNGTNLYDRPFERVQVERDEHDWVFAWVEDWKFNIACGPTSLSEALWIFRKWADA